MNKIAVIGGVVGVVILLIAAGAHATQIIFQTPREMGAESALVVRGTVASVKSFWNDSQTKILTETVINIDETYKGGAGSTARILQLGGVVDNVRMHVHGAPSWTRGEEVFLFLERIDAANYRVSGLSQGKFKVERDPITGEPFVTYPMIENTELTGAPPAGDSRRAPQAVKKPLTEFVEDALGSSAGGTR
ncbi:MAG: hypothetical protein P8181_12540 [bacterium]